MALKGVLQMSEKYNVLQSVLITAILMGAVAGVTVFAEPDLTEQTLQAIKDCI